MTLEKLFDDALTALRKQRYNLAYDLFTEAMEREPEMPEIHYNRGIAASHLLRWEDAEGCFRMALRMQKDPDYWVHLGLVHLHQARWEEACDDFDNALMLDPGSELAQAHQNDLKAFLKSGNQRHATYPPLCAGWFDPRLKAFVGIDPQIVTKAERVDLRKYVAEALGGDPGSCDHSFETTEEWALRTGRDPLGVSRFLYERGLRCDCEVLAEPERLAAKSPVHRPRSGE